ncbi:MAG: glycine betaine ABC transporter substrate-binding protein [Acidimicrobiales bacterium]
MRSTRTVLALSLAGALALTACGGDDDTATTEPAASPTVNVGHVDEPLSNLLAEIYGQGMENAGVRVGRKDPAASMDALYDQLAAGSLQFVPDSTVSVLERFGVTEMPATTDEQIVAMEKALPADESATLVSSATRTMVVACRADVIDDNSVTNLTDLAKVAADVKLGATPGFETSPSFGLDDLNAAYSAEFTVTPAGDDDAAVVQAVVDGTVDCGVVSSLEPSITTSGLLPVTDDQAAAPVDAIVPVMQAIAATPEVSAVVTQINGLLTTDVLRALLVKVAAGEQSVDVIAKDWLASQSSSS